MRPSGELEAVVVSIPGWRIVSRCFRPLAGQRVRLHLYAWRLRRDSIPYVWQRSDTLAGMAAFTGFPEDEILRANRLHNPQQLIPGTQITLPVYEGTYRLEAWDTLDRVARSFGYASGDALAELNGIEDPLTIDARRDLRLPGWFFCYARERDILPAIDAMFSLPAGSTVTVGRVFHPDPRVPYPGETIAVPSRRVPGRPVLERL